MWKKILQLRILKRIYLERLGEPFIYNLVSLYVLLFGNIVAKINYDLVPRQPYAFGLNEAFYFASNEKNKLNINRLIICEFGVASGAGLMNLCKISDSLSKHYDFPCKIVGFDTGVGMPEPINYRDHPEKYRCGDYVPHDKDLLIKSLPSNSNIYYGPVSETIEKFKHEISEGDYLGFISIDVDYYSSSVECLKLFKSCNVNILPRMPIYFDDVNNIDHNEFCGELLAINEFNSSSDNIKISKMNQIRNWRIFKSALYLDQMYWLFDFRSNYFTQKYHSEIEPVQLSNPYLGQSEKNHFGP